MEAIGEAANKGLSRWHSQGRKLGAKVRRERRQGMLGLVLEPHEGPHDSGPTQQEPEGYTVIATADP